MCVYSGCLLSVLVSMWGSVGMFVVKGSGLLSLGVVKYVVCLCRGCDRYCIFCLNCEAWSYRCSCMESISVCHADVECLYIMCILCFTGSGVNKVQVVLLGFSVRLLCFVQVKTLCRYGCMYFLTALMLVCVYGICVRHDLNWCSG